MTKTSGALVGIGWRSLVLAAGLAAGSAAAWGAECATRNSVPFSADDAEDFAGRVRTLDVAMCVGARPKGIAEPSFDEWCIPGTTYEGAAETIQKSLLAKGYDVRMAAIENGHSKLPEEADTARVSVVMVRERVDGGYQVYAQSSVIFGRTLVHKCEIRDGARAYEDAQRYLYTVRHSLEHIPARQGGAAAGKAEAPAPSVDKTSGDSDSRLGMAMASHICNGNGKDAADADRGLAYLAPILAESPNDSVALETQGNCYLMKGNQTEARKSWMKALPFWEDTVKRTPNHSGALASLTDLEVKLGRCAKARAHLDELERLARSEGEESWRMYAGNVRKGREKCRKP